MQAQRARTTVTLLTADQEIQLTSAWQQNGDQRALSTLCARFDPFIQSRVAKLAKGVQGENRDDLVQEARVGFLRAVEKYDASTGFRLSTYARAWIDAAVRDTLNELRGRKHLVTTALGKRITYNHARATEQATRQLAGTALSHDRSALQRTTADLLGVPLSALERHESTLRVLHLDAPVADAEGGVATARDFVPCPLDLDPERLVSESLDRDRLAARVVQAMGTLPARSAEIVRNRALSDEPLTLEVLAKRFNVSRERIRQIEEKALASLQTDLAPIRHLLHA
jgi:RNA polymerase sigma-32 factor